MGCADRHNPFFLLPALREGWCCRVASELVLPVGHHQNLASLNTPAKHGFSPAGKDLSLISTSYIKIL